MVLPRSEVHVWRTALDGGRSDPVLRRVLSKYMSEEPGTIELRTGPQGKPELAAGSSLQFNLSHSGELMLVAVAAARAVGVDVERIDAGRDFLGLAARALGTEAVATLQAKPEDERAGAFHQLWVRHEARLKCGGGGLADRAPTGPVTVTALAVDDGYAAALAVAGTERPSVRSFSLLQAD